MQSASCFSILPEVPNLWNVHLVILKQMGEMVLPMFTGRMQSASCFSMFPEAPNLWNVHLVILKYIALIGLWLQSRAQALPKILEYIGSDMFNKLCQVYTCTVYTHCINNAFQYRGRTLFLDPINTYQYTVPKIINMYIRIKTGYVTVGSDAAVFV